MISHERVLEIFQPTIRFKTALHEYLYIWLYSHLNRLKANLYFNIFFLDIVDIDIVLILILYISNVVKHVFFLILS